MRTLLAFLITVPWVHASEADLTLLQARGLIKGRCYQEYVTFSCETECALAVFPMTIAELRLRVEGATPEQRKTLGRFFESRFVVEDDVKGLVSLQSLKSVSIETVARALPKLSGLLTPVTCAPTSAN